MAIGNIQETLLMYTKQKTQLTNKISDISFNLLNASKQVATEQSRYNSLLSSYYYDYYEDDPEQYEVLVEQAENEHELALAAINSWESELELNKNTYESRLNEISTFESSWTKLLQTNVKNDFSYGGISGQ
ncbi:hypothetical protein J6E39_07800 [bacterium]|nr:hypothetical protein [bacterium]